jgi:hypothetical protein
LATGRRKKATMVTYEEYTEKLTSIGDSILNWADPENEFRGYTEVRGNPERKRGVTVCNTHACAVCSHLQSFPDLSLSLLPFFSDVKQGWPVTDFVTAFNVAAAYLIFVFVGSAIMKLGVPAVDPYPLKFVYNVSQIMLCSYMTIEAFLLAKRNNYTVLPCQPYDKENAPIANLLWIFYISKIWDFWDTIFIVLGKKWRQLSFLHVYHHTTIFLFYWLNTLVFYDADVYLTIVLNGFIHTIMYTYYCKLSTALEGES